LTDRMGDHQAATHPVLSQEAGEGGLGPNVDGDPDEVSDGDHSEDEATDSSGSDGDYSDGKFCYSHGYTLKEED
jgi:hypothetical protein